MLVYMGSLVFEAEDGPKTKEEAETAPDGMDGNARGST